MMKDLVSVIVPVYNVEKYLKRSIDSILAQTYENIEIIIVNDGSTDSSRSILSKYENEYTSKIVVYDKANGGLSSARNLGLDMANGEYIAFIDSDDTINKNMISDMVKMLKEYNCDISMCGRFDEYTSKQVEKYTLDNPIVFNSSDVIKNILIRKNMDFAACDKLYKKELWKDIRFPNGKNHEDMYTIPYIIRESKKIIHIGKPYYHYYHREGSITTTINEKRVRDYYDAVHSISKIVKNNYNNIIKEYIFFMNNSYLTLLILINKVNEKNKKIMSIENEAKNYLKINWRNKFSLGLMSKRRKLTYFLIKHSIYSVLTDIKTVIKGKT